MSVSMSVGWLSVVDAATLSIRSLSSLIIRLRVNRKCCHNREERRWWNSDQEIRKSKTDIAESKLNQQSVGVVYTGETKTTDTSAVNGSSLFGIIPLLKTPCKTMGDSLKI